MKLWAKYLIAILVGCAFAVFTLITNGITVATDKKEIIKIICNAFTVPGLLFLLFGGLLFCVSNGAFYGISYVIHSLLVNHNWSRTKFKDKETYAEYVEAKRANAQPVPKYIFLVGACFTVIAVIFLIIYYNI